MGFRFRGREIYRKGAGRVSPASDLRALTVVCHSVKPRLPDFYLLLPGIRRRVHDLLEDRLCLSSILASSTSMTHLLVSRRAWR